MTDINFDAIDLSSAFSSLFSIKSSLLNHRKLLNFSVFPINDLNEIEQYKKSTGIIIENITISDQYSLYVLIFDTIILILDLNNLQRLLHFFQNIPKETQLFYIDSQIETVINELKAENFKNEITSLINFDQTDLTQIENEIIKLIIKKSQLRTLQLHEKLRSNEYQSKNDRFTKSDFIKIESKTTKVKLCFNIIDQILYILKEFNLTDNDSVRKFNHEVSFYDEIDNESPFISKCFGYFKDQYFGYIVVEYIEGKTLLDYIINTEDIITKNDITHVIQILLAIECIHLKNLILRDLKYDNVMIDSNDVAILIDFDESRKIDLNDDDEMTGNIGSMNFTAPEQNNSNKYSSKVDIYSLGMLIHFIFTKKIFNFPFFETMNKINKNEMNILDSEKIAKLQEKYSFILDNYKDCCNYLPNERPNIMNVIERFFKLMKQQENNDDELKYTTEIFFKIREHQFESFFISSYNCQNEMIDELIVFFGNSYFESDYIPVNIDKYIYYLKFSAALNNALAQYYIGYYYFNGLYVDKDIEKGIYFLTLSASENNTKAQYFLGSNYYNEKSGIYDLKKSIFYFELASDNNDSDSQFYLSVIYISLGNIEKAMHYMTLSAENNNYKARFYLGQTYFLGKDVKQDIQKAIKYLSPKNQRYQEEASNILKMIYVTNKSQSNYIDKKISDLTLMSYLQNDSNSQCFLGFIYYRCQYIPRDILKAIQFLTLASNQNNPCAQYLLGEIFYSGEFVEKDIEKAIRYLTLSADQNDPNAQYLLGDFYIVKQNVDKGINLLKESTNQGNDKAQLLLGLIYYDGKKVEKNIEIAIHYLTLSADQNNREAQYVLGDYYYSNQHDVNKAIHYLTLSADQNYQDAQILLALILYSDKNIERNINKAIKYFKNASCFNNSIAKNNLGVIYMKGDGVDKNIINAITYFEEAIKHDVNPAASFNLARILYFGIDDIEKDLKRAIKLLEQSICEYFVPNELFLYFIYTYGHESLIDKKQSAYYFEKIKNTNIFNDVHFETSPAFINKMELFFKEYNIDYTVELIQKGIFVNNFCSFMNS